MSKKIDPVTLSVSEYHEVERLITTGKHAARVLNRARILLLCHEQEADTTVAETVRVSPATVARIRRRYCQDGFLKALHDHPRSGAPAKVSGRAQAKLAVLACTTPPDGRVRGTTRLWADRLVQLEEVESISHRAVGVYLKKRTQPLVETTVVHSPTDGEFLMRMEDLLDLYARPYDPEWPLICVDARPCQLLGGPSGPDSDAARQMLHRWLSL